MLPQDIRDIIKKEAEAKYPEHPSGYVSPMVQRKRDSYTEGATKYAERAGLFLNWKEGRFYCQENGAGFHSYMESMDRVYTTSDLLTIFLKEKSNLANENNIV